MSGERELIEVDVLDPAGANCRGCHGMGCDDCQDTGFNDVPVRCTAVLYPGSLDEAKMRLADAAVTYDVAREQQGIYSPEYIEAWHGLHEAIAVVRALTKGETDGPAAPVSRESGTGERTE